MRDDSRTRSITHLRSGDSTAAYTLSTTWSGNDFLSSDWVWYTGNDEANGRMNYVTEAVAQQEKTRIQYVLLHVFFSVLVGSS